METYLKLSSEYYDLTRNLYQTEKELLFYTE